MIYCKEHNNAGTIVRLKEQHIAVYCKQCNRLLKLIDFDEIDECFEPELDEGISSNVTQVEEIYFTSPDDNFPW